MSEIAPQELRRRALESIRHGSKSFFWAGLLLSRETRDDAFLLYSFCRFCDDRIDTAAASERPARLDELEKSTWRALHDPLQADGPYAALAYVVQKHAIPHQYPMDLIFGMRMDLERSRYADFRELSTYCYHVAGVVGLMMSYILGVSAERAYLHACHLGMAMQLTNICRDIREDWRLGRIYLPMNWLRDAHIDTDRADWLDREIELMSVVRRMLGEAEHLYRSGDRGLRFLSFRSRLAILAARLVYSEIGRQLLRRGPAGLRSRVVTSPFRKAALLSKSVFKNVLSLAWLRPWRRSTPREVFLYVPESF